MRKLELVGLDSDGRFIVFADDAGDEYVAPADERLRAALRGDRARLGQLEIDMDSALRPRDIQARIRAGETPEAVAVVAQVSVDKIMPYCVPVLAERRHISDLARRHHVRRKNTEGPARSLDTVVSERLRGRGIDPDATTWDAWRRDDGRWAVRARYQSGEREHLADFVFDTIGRYTLADDDEAKWLTGEQQSTRKGPQPREGGVRSGERRLSSVRTGDDLLSLSGDDGPRDHDRRDDDQAEEGWSDDDRSGDGWRDDDEAGDVPDDELTDDLTAVVRAVREPEYGDPGSRPLEPQPPEADGPEPSVPGQDFGGQDLHADEASDHAFVGQPDQSEDADSESATSAASPPAAHSAATAADSAEVVPDRPRRATRRAAVPSWDEIMLGKRKDDAT